MTKTRAAELWPDQKEAMQNNGTPDLDVVKRTEYDTIEAAFRLGVQAELGTARVWSQSLKEYVVWTRPPVPGQVCKAPNPNILLIVVPRYRADKVVTIEYGCAHEFETVVQRNCYREARCTKCGYHYGVDSGD